MLDQRRIEAIAVGLEEIVALPDPVGEQVERRTLRSGVELERIRVPIGVIAIVYEARPNVTVDCAALCLKSGQEDGRFYLSAGDRHVILDGVEFSATDFQRGQPFFITAKNLSAHTRQRVDNPLHGPPAKRTVTVQPAGKWATGHDPGEQPHRGSRIAAIHYVVGRR
jgi:hypothetical protein